MKKLVLLATSFCVMAANAQTYMISFAGSGSSTTVSTVKVENLKTGTTLTLSGSDNLRLNVTTGVNSEFDSNKSNIRIFPNPVTGNSTMEIFAPEPGNATISLLDFTGRPVTVIKSYLGNFSQRFRLSGIKKGIYIVNVKGRGYQYSEKLISDGISGGPAGIEKIGSFPLTNDEKIKDDNSKGVMATYDMEYHTGDWLKFTGTSGNYSTVKTDIPTVSKTITFNFTGCTDGDGNNYPVVQIWNQIWMAENLKTTKYSDGTAITFVTDNVAWLNMTAPAYCWYNNDILNKPVYGAIYNFYAVSTGKLCPAGWHVSSDAEWTVLTGYLGGLSVAGNKLKDTGADFWDSAPPSVTNESGFTALPAGDRYVTDNGGFIFSGLRYRTTFWTNTSPYSRTVYSINPEILRGEFGNYASGFSVRCLKD
jgi:uncharacterized protein (TIGR02145 family)